MKRILLFDDSDLTLRVARGALEAAGFEVIPISDANQLPAATRQQPDLILVDVNTPDFFGDDLVQYLREEWHVRVPIHLFSSMDERELAERARQSGADGYLSKKRGVDALVSRVSEILGEA